MHVISQLFQPSVFHDCIRLSDRVSHRCRRRRRRCLHFCSVVCACRHLCYEKKRTKFYCENMYGSPLFTALFFFLPSSVYLFERAFLV